MRGTFGFDPAQCSYGAATAAVQQVLTEWMAIDWFVPPGPAPGAEVAATRSFSEHHRRARAHQPELFPANLEMRPTRGSWRGFGDLCASVRARDEWDWKYAALKLLSFRHSQARGWSLKDAARARPSIEQAIEQAIEPRRVPGPGDLFWGFGDNVFWVDPGPRLDLRSALAPGHAEEAGWYLGYAGMDLIECIEWQLAEQSDHLDGNPFLPLVRCYAAGFYPFSLGPADVVLFGFSQEP